MHSIDFTKQATKTLLALPADARGRLLAKIEALALDPTTGPNVKKLVGRPGYRLRVGDWRVLYDIDSGRLVIRILNIGARGGVYR